MAPSRRNCDDYIREEEAENEEDGDAIDLP